MGLKISPEASGNTLAHQHSRPLPVRSSRCPAATTEWHSWRSLHILARLAAHTHAPPFTGPETFFLTYFPNNGNDHLKLPPSLGTSSVIKEHRRSSDQGGAHLQADTGEALGRARKTGVPNDIGSM